MKVTMTSRLNSGLRSSNVGRVGRTFRMKASFLLSFTSIAENCMISLFRLIMACRCPDNLIDSLLALDSSPDDTLIHHLTDDRIVHKMVGIPFRGKTI